MSVVSTQSEVVFACHSKACAPPPVGSGGSKGGAGGGSSSKSSSAPRGGGGGAAKAAAPKSGGGGGGGWSKETMVKDNFGEMTKKQVSKSFNDGKYKGTISQDTTDQKRGTFTAQLTRKGQSSAMGKRKSFKTKTQAEKWLDSQASVMARVEAKNPPKRGGGRGKSIASKNAPKPGRTVSKASQAKANKLWDKLKEQNRRDGDI
jgi:hypothetical protein